MMITAPPPELYYVAGDDFVADVTSVAKKVIDDGWSPDFVIGIGRGGLVPAVYVSHRLDVPMLSIDHSSKLACFADELLVQVAERSRRGVRFLFIDDINDSGGTIAHIKALLADGHSDNAYLRFAVLINNERSQVKVDYWARTIDRASDKRWFVFPWEAVGSKETIVHEALSVPERLG